MIVPTKDTRVYTPEAILGRVTTLWETPRREPAATWVPGNVVFPRGVSPIYGLWASDLFRYLLGPLEAFDDSLVESITLCMGTRIGKTSVIFGLLCYIAACDPSPCLVVLPDEKKAKGISRRLQKVLEASEATRDLLPPKTKRNWSELELANGCVIYFAWSGSPTTLGDRAIKYAFLIEMSKYSSSASLEADPAELAEERVKGYPEAKVIRDSTPTILGRCRIWSHWLESDQREYHVPCPHCDRRQRLEMGAKLDDGRRWGLVWDGNGDPDEARATARYVCRHCFEVIDPLMRPDVLRAGRWIPKDAGDDGASAFASTRAGFRLPTLYAALTSWGVTASKFLRSKNHPKKLQNFVNSWLSEIWSVTKKQTTAEQVAARLGIDVPAGVVPEGVVFVSAGVDMQPIQGHFNWIVAGWGRDGAGWLIDYGLADSWEAVQEDVIDAVYENRDGSRTYRPVVSLIDSGSQPDPVYRFCAQPGNLRRVLPLKGTDHLGSGKAYEVRPFEQTKGANRLQREIRKLRGLHLVHVSRDYFESWLQDRLDNKRAGETGALHLCREATIDRDLLDQILNGALILDQDDRTGREKLEWQKVRPHEPDDFRAALRYASAAAELHVRGRWHLVGRPKKTAPRPNPKREGKKNFATEGGRSW